MNVKESSIIKLNSKISKLELHQVNNYNNENASRINEHIQKLKTLLNVAYNISESDFETLTFNNVSIIDHNIKFYKATNFNLIADQVNMTLYLSYKIESFKVKFSKKINLIETKYNYYDNKTKCKRMHSIINDDILKSFELSDDLRKNILMKLDEITYNFYRKIILNNWGLEFDTNSYNYHEFEQLKNLKVFK